MKAAALLVLLAATPVMAQEVLAQEIEEDVRGRMEWERHKVVFPADSVPSDTFLKMVEQVDRFERFQRHRSPLALTPINWEPLGPQPIADGQFTSGDPRDVSGRVNAIAVNPKNPSHWVIGASGGGIWQSTNAGVSWESSPDDSKTMVIGAVAFSADGTTIYGGTGNPEVLGGPRGVFRGLGVLRSTDTGRTWELVGRTDLAGCSFSAMRVHPKDARKLVASTVGTCRRFGLVSSNDGGASWTVETPGFGTDLDADFRNGDLSRLYGGIFGQGIFRKREGSNAWARVKDPWASTDSPGRIMVAIAPGTLERVYVSVHDQRTGGVNDLLGLWYTDNAWDLDPTKIVWVKIDTSRTDGRDKPIGGNLLRGYCRTQCWYDHRILADTADQDTLYAGGISLWRCDRCTSTSPGWTDLSLFKESIHVDQHALFMTGGSTSTTPQPTFKKYRHGVTWCGGTNQGGGFRFAEPTSSTLSLSVPELSSCSALDWGVASVSGTLTVPASGPSGSLNPSYRYNLDPPITINLELDLSWKVASRCNRPGITCTLPATLFAKITDTLDTQVICEKADTRTGYQAGQTLNLHVSLSCPVSHLDQLNDDPSAFASRLWYGFYYQSPYSDDAVLDVRTSAVYNIAPPTPTPPRLIIGNDGGVFSALNPKTLTGWTDHNKTLSITQFDAGAANPVFSTRGIGGSQDNGTELWTGNEEWRHVVGGDGGDVAIATGQNASWGAVVNGNYRIVRTLDNGTTQEDIDDGLDIRKLPFYIRLAKCPNSDDVFLTGTDAQLDDVAKTPAPALVMRNDAFFKPSPRWSRNVEDFIAFPSAITALAFAPSTGDCSTYAAASESTAQDNPTISVTEDNGTTWRRIGVAPNLPNRYVSDLEFSRTNPNVLWVAFLGVDSSTPGRPGHLFRTDDALGTSGTPAWVNKTPVDPDTGRPIDMGVHTVFLDPANRGTVYIGTDLAIWKSTDDGDHWTFMGPETGMPNVPVRDIQSNVPGAILAFTYGRGAFKYKQSKADLGIAKTSPPQVQVGDTFTYLITVTNYGPDTATSVTVRDTLPPEMTFVAARPGQGSCRGTTTIECDLGSIGGKSPPVGIAIDVTATKVGTYFNKAKVISAAVDDKPLDNDAIAKTEVVDIKADLAIVKGHTGDRVTVDEELTYTIEVTNNGPNDATQVVVTDTLPPDVTFVSAGPGCTGTSTITCNLGDIPKGGRKATFISVKTTKPGSLTNTAGVTGKEKDPNTANNTSTHTVQVLSADVSVEKTATPNPAKVGERLTFYITVKNNGPDRAHGVTVSDYLFPDLTLVSATATQGTCTGSPTVVCTIGEMASGTTERITIVVIPQKAGRYCNTADVTHEEHDKDKSNDSSTVCVDVESGGSARCDRAITKRHSPEPAPLNGRVTWTLTVRNNGPDATTGVTVEDLLPKGVTGVTSSASQGSCSGTVVVTCGLGNIAAGASATITITGTPTLVGIWANTAGVLGNETDPNGGNDVATDYMTVVAAPAITALTPASAKQGTRNIDLKIDGVNFVAGTAVSFEPAAGIEVVTPPGPNFGFVSTVEIHRTIHIAEGAAVGEREVHVTNPDGTAGGLRPFDVFTVLPGANPTIAVSPSSLDFGTLAAKGTRDRSLTIQNTGTGPLTVRALGAAPPYTVTSPAAPFDVPAGGQQTVSLRFAPAVSGTSRKTLVISSNDASRPSVSVPLSGTATTPPILDPAPAALNFGTVPAGQSRSLTIRLRNKGEAALTVTSVTSSSASFSAPMAVPFDVAPLAERTLTVTYAPQAVGAQTGKLTLASNDPESPSLDVQLRGEASPSGFNENLSLDDGTVESGVSGDGIVVVNRLTPSRYPTKLTKISVYFLQFLNRPNPTGGSIRLIAYADPSGAGASTQHPQLLLNQAVTVPQVPSSGGVTIDFEVANGPTITAGDLYVGFQSPNPQNGVIPAADTNGPQKNRGYFSTDGGGTFGGPLYLGGAPANLMIRATTTSGGTVNPCTWGIAPAKLPVPKEGGSGTIDVSAPVGCPWSVTSDASFVTFSAAPGGAAEIASAKSPATRSADHLSNVSGTGNGTVRYTVAPATGSADRTATISIAQLESKVAQTIAPPGGAASYGRDVFVPIVLSTAGLNGSFFSSELTLTNRGTTSAVVQAAYTAAFGGGGGSAFDVLAPGTQRVYPDGLTYLKSIGTPMPEAGNRGGTVALSFSNLSSAGAGAATVRTSTRVPEGRAGLAYSGIPAATALTVPVYVLGLRQNATDRSNLALMNSGTQGDVVLRVTVYSGESALAATLPEVALGPGGFSQITGILATNGLALSNGYAKVERVGGTAPYFTYGVINDQANSDGSFVPPVSPASLTGRAGLTVPVIVETPAFLSELVVTNFGTARKTVRLALVTEAGTASFSLDLTAGQQVLIPNLVAYLRERGVTGLGAAGSTVVGSLFLTVDGGDASGIFAGARTSSAGGGGRYGLFYTAVPSGTGATRTAWLYGLLQDAENRTNLALVNTGEVDGSTDVFQLDIYDGDTGHLVKTVDGLGLGPRRWVQITTILALYAPGVTNSYVKVTKTEGSNPFLAYAVVNDGGQPGQRSGDGAFLPMADVDE